MDAMTVKAMQQVFEVPAEAAKLDDGCCPRKATAAASEGTAKKIGR
jgi:hypothetical protein